MTPSMGSYSSLIFDLDDTLIASFGPYLRLHQQIASDLNLRIPSREELIAYGPTWKATLERIWPNQDLEPFFDRYHQIADDNPYPSIPGIPETLKGLKDQGYVLWVVTKRSRLRLHQRMREAGIDKDLFSGIFPVEDQPAAKPDPKCFEPVWSAMGSKPNPGHAIYVGDRREDMQAAHAAELDFLAVQTGPEIEIDDFTQELPSTRVLPSVAHLPNWLDTHSAKKGMSCS